MAVPEELTQLRQELASTLRRAEKNRRIIRATRTPIYLIAALWMIFVLASAFAGGIFLPADQARRPAASCNGYCPHSSS